MSGWVGVVRFDGGPVDRELFESLAASIRWRGPDGSSSWIGDGAAFAHALFITTPQGTGERMPAVRGDAVLCGDIRLDAREELVSKLGLERAEALTDSALLLHAWEGWGDALTDHLIGDFSFALWDARSRRLLLARDHFARRPLFYARRGEALLVTNDLPALLAVPGLADELDEFAVGDFLLFGRNLHAERTTFANIRRVPAAHRAIVTGHFALQRYWTIPWRDQPRRIRERDAHAEFREVFSRAVGDRLPADRVVLSLSGGLDSNAVASTITELRRAGRTAVETSALTTVWRKDIEDDEERYAALAAAAYQIPLELHAADGCEAFAEWDDLRVRGLEPTDEPCSAAFYGFVAAAARHARVILTGEGGDPLLYNSHEHFFRLLTRLRFDRFLLEAGGYLIRRRKRPPLNLRSQLLRALGRPPRGLPAYPSWIASDLESGAQLRDRWQEVLVPTARLHPYRNEAARMLDSASWARAFEVTDPGASGQLVEWRSPYFDVRLVEFLFSLPPMPHFAEKDLVRESLRGRMPEAIRRRPKRALSRDPSALAFERQRERWIREVDTAAEVASYVDRRILTKNLREASHNDYGSSQQAFAVGLSIWLTRRNR